VAALVPDDDDGTMATKVTNAFKETEKEIVRSSILNTKRRIDGRDLTTVRPIVCEVGILPRTHGSALFTRGETQALAVATLGTGEDEQYVDALQGTYKETFMLHYNFPPYSVGEVGRMTGPGRREIGHGKLAWRAIHPVLPDRESFPYTIRIVSEITESNGSSSMATVCGSSLAMMDAGIPLKRSVAGIAMGLIKEAANFAVLSDILGDEDHLGDMDFKVAGTSEGVTSLQMDIKITGISEEIMKVALNQARDGRMHILAEMDKALQFPGVSNAWTMPIKARIDMLSTGIRTPIGIKVFGADLEVMERLAKQIEAAVKTVPGTSSAFAERITGADVCVTGDIPLASRCLAKGARAVPPTGRPFTPANIGNALAGREISRHLREIGASGKGPTPFTKADRSRFLSALDTAVQAALRSQPPIAP